jgi:alanine racemase
MVRLGIGLYGVSAFADEQQKLLPVGELKTSLVQIKKVLAGESIGYGLSYTANSDMTIGIIPIGYADGFRRSLSNGMGKVWVNNIPCPVVGKVCMDTTMIDISQTQAEEGDSVVVFGPTHSIQDFAADCNTIAYEILTGIPARVRRVFINET